VVHVDEEEYPKFTRTEVPEGVVAFQVSVAATVVLVPLPTY
jgi:hypothetical protein